MVKDDKMRERIALFRYGLIADLVHREPAEKGLYPLLHAKAERVYEIPGTRRTRVASDVELRAQWQDLGGLVAGSVAEIRERISLARLGA